MTGERFKSKLILILVLVSGITLTIMFYLYHNLYEFKQFLPGVRIASVPVQGCNQEQASRIIQDWLDEAYHIPIIFYNDGYSYETMAGELCQHVNTNKVIEEIWNKEKHRNWKSKVSNIRGNKWITYPIAIDYDPMALQKVIDEVSKHLDVEPVNARLKVDIEKGLVIIPGIIGKSVDYRGTFVRLPREWGEFNRIELPVILQEEYPKVNEESLKKMGELSSFTTWYNVGDIDRSHNLFLAASAINSSVIQPGDVFSFNQTVGERTYEAGYRDALVIIGDKFEPGTGGGVCQVSSTLYNACLLSGLEIVERHNHALAVAYVPLGRDATVVYGLQDFSFKNNTGYPVYIRAVTEAGKLTINIYGHMDYLQNIELSHVVDEVIDFEEVRKINPDLEPGEEKVDIKGFPGYVVRSFRTFKDEEGGVIKQEKLATDKYKPLNTLIYVGLPDESETTNQEEVISDEQDEIQPEGENNNNGEKNMGKNKVNRDEGDQL